MRSRLSPSKLEPCRILCSYEYTQYVPLYVYPPIPHLTPLPPHCLSRIIEPLSHFPPIPPSSLPTQHPPATVKYVPPVTPYQKRKTSTTPLPLPHTRKAPIPISRTNHPAHPLHSIPLTIPTRIAPPPRYNPLLLIHQRPTLSPKSPAHLPTSRPHQRAVVSGTPAPRPRDGPARTRILTAQQHRGAWRARYRQVAEDMALRWRLCGGGGCGVREEECERERKNEFRSIDLRLEELNKRKEEHGSRRHDLLTQTPISDFRLLFQNPCLVLPSQQHTASHLPDSDMTSASAFPRHGFSRK